MSALNILIHPALLDVLPQGVLQCTPLVPDVFTRHNGWINPTFSCYPMLGGARWVLLTKQDDPLVGLPLIGPDVVCVSDETSVGILSALREYLIFTPSADAPQTTPRFDPKAMFAARCAHSAAMQWAQRVGENTLAEFDKLDGSTFGSILRGVHLLMVDPNVTPQMSHEAWFEGKVAEGWVYGPVKDFEKKTHPCCLPYDQLSSADRAKDILFRGVVLTALSVYDMGIDASATE